MTITVESVVVVIAIVVGGQFQAIDGLGQLRKVLPQVVLLRGTDGLI